MSKTHQNLHDRDLHGPQSAPHWRDLEQVFRSKSANLHIVPISLNLRNSPKSAYFTTKGAAGNRPSLGEVPLDGTDTKAPSLLILEELVQGASTETVHLLEHIVSGTRIRR